MNSPYYYELKDFENRDRAIVTLHRAGAADVSGWVEVVGDSGVTLANDKGEGRERTFVAYEDIRGVVSRDWNYEVIS